MKFTEIIGKTLHTNSMYFSMKGNSNIDKEISLYFFYYEEFVNSEVIKKLTGSYGSKVLTKNQNILLTSPTSKLTEFFDRDKILDLKWERLQLERQDNLAHICYDFFNHFTENGYWVESLRELESMNFPVTKFQKEMFLLRNKGRLAQ